MSRESRNGAPGRSQPTLFGPPEQPDLFGPPPAPQRYVPKPEHVRSGLRSLLERLATAETWWKWSDWDIERYRERDVRYYCDLLPDRDEAAAWRRQFAVEIARLDAVRARPAPRTHLSAVAIAIPCGGRSRPKIVLQSSIARCWLRSRDVMVKPGFVIWISSQTRKRDPGDIEGDWRQPPVCIRRLPRCGGARPTGDKRPISTGMVHPGGRTVLLARFALAAFAAIAGGFWVSCVEGFWPRRRETTARSLAPAAISQGVPEGRPAPAG